MSMAAILERVLAKNYDLTPEGFLTKPGHEFPSIFRAQCAARQAQISLDEFTEAYRVLERVAPARGRFITAGQAAYEIGRIVDRRISPGAVIAAAIALKRFKVRRFDYGWRAGETIDIVAGDLRALAQQDAA